jgi:hypothetical protein
VTAKDLGLKLKICWNFLKCINLLFSKVAILSKNSSLSLRERVGVRG